MAELVDDKVIERIKKLLALANNNPNEAEAEAAMAKATAMLEAYNLDAHTIGGHGSNARADKKRNGGLYTWQRKLWAAVAELNFCYYSAIKGLARGSQYEHQIIGSKANVIATELMAEYLQGAIEKLAQQWAKDNYYKSVFVREAIAYREGMAQRVADRLVQRRWDIVTKARQEAEERKRNQARGEIVTGNELTILDVISSEEDFNNDYLYGYEMGHTARRRHENEVRWAAQKAAKEQWARDNPEEHARQMAEEQRRINEWLAKEAKRKPRKEVERKLTAEQQRQKLGSYWEGRDAGARIGIDTQVNADKKARIA